jgi:hypothetical protein
MLPVPAALFCYVWCLTIGKISQNKRQEFRLSLSAGADCRSPARSSFPRLPAPLSGAVLPKWDVAILSGLPPLNLKEATARS